MAFKIDLKKAYDNVDWNFLHGCLEEFGFPPIITKLIMHCVSSSSLSIIWNGKRLPYFSPTRGLQQGDPLSPYLFMICMEKLSLSIIEAVQDKIWHPIKVSKSCPTFSHLLFTNDVLLFSKPINSQAKMVADLFTRFSMHSGLRVSIVKSRVVFSAGVPSGEKREDFSYRFYSQY